MGYAAANGNRVGVQPDGSRPPELPRNRLMCKKKDPEPKLEAFSPDGYSGGKGGAARLKYTGH